MTALETSIRQQLHRHLTGELTLAQFTDWFVSESWGVDPQADPGASQLTYAIELALAERVDNVLTAEELAATLRNLAQSRSVAAQAGGSRRRAKAPAPMCAIHPDMSF